MSLKSRVGSEITELRLRSFVKAQNLGDLTMVGAGPLREVVRAVDRIVLGGIPGAVVECGVWRGGSAFLAAKRLAARGDRRLVWLFDSFEGLPPPQQIDGPAALDWAADVGSDRYRDNCAASLEEVEESQRRLGLVEQTRLVKGWFSTTLPATRAEIGPIALLRIDADWYESVRCCLDELFDQVSEGGVVLFDDYYAWDGCALAVHDFLSERRLPLRIRSASGNAYFIKA